MSLLQQKLVISCWEEMGDEKVVSSSADNGKDGTDIKFIL